MKTAQKWVLKQLQYILPLIENAPHVNLLMKQFDW
jgi:hypothetical protein